MAGFYGSTWDNYVEHYRQQERSDGFPGDEWGNPGWWNICYDRLLNRAGASNWQRAVEIGPGSGKYTELLLERSTAEVIGFDVSEKFVGVLRDRAAKYIEQNRLKISLLGCREPDEMLVRIDELGWRGLVDGFFSIDSMVHVDLQYLVAYLVTAAISLRRGGALVLTLADATTGKGLAKLLHEIKLYYPLQGVPSRKFEFVSGDLISSVLERIGFKIELLEYDSGLPRDSRDLFVIARKVDADVEVLESYLR